MTIHLRWEGTRVTHFQAYGTMYGVRRTTIYLPEDLKSSLARAAQEEGRTEADLIRENLISRRTSTGCWTASARSDSSRHQRVADCH